MTPPPVEKRFAILCEIVRAQHFAWRRAVAELCPEVDAAAVADRMWEITGVETGEAYARHLDADAPLAQQLADSVAWSSQCMGEDAASEPASPAASAGGVDEAFVRHDDCPWYHWHERLGLLDEDRSGCDAWFASTAKTLSAIVGKEVRCETLSSLPDGDDCCRRRLWIEGA